MYVGVCFRILKIIIIHKFHSTTIAIRIQSHWFPFLLNNVNKLMQNQKKKKKKRKEKSYLKISNLKKAF